MRISSPTCCLYGRRSVNDPVRRGPRGLEEGNYLAFAIACRWLRWLDYVHPPGGCNDVLQILFKNRDPRSGLIELTRFPLGSDATASRRGRVEPLSIEPAVPLRSVRMEDFEIAGPFDFGYVSVSPRFAPPQAEKLLPVIGRCIRL